jgi:uncharacterized protein YdiU (UPF0061 family)
MQLHIDDTFSKELPADPITAHTRRQVFKACYSLVTPKIPSQPQVLHVSDFYRELGLSSAAVSSEAFKATFSGAQVLEGTSPYAMCYGGHQFGHWAGQLGDGRAINLMEVLHQGQRWALQLKGAGETPYSRSADGLAVLRSSIREHLCSEAMYHLGVPTTRSLSLCLSGDQVWRDMMYDGNAAYEQGAIVCRAAPSFIRFGNFQILASRGDKETLTQLVDYTIKYFYPEIDIDSPSRFSALLNAVSEKTLDMIVHWQRVGFVHGVMNTDNMSILGLTIDYGPYGWLEGYEHGWTPNTTDRQNKRYRYGHQPAIALWNLNQLANALYLLEPEAGPFQEILKNFQATYLKKYYEMMSQKLGLGQEEMVDREFINQLEKNLELVETDMTIFFRELSKILPSDTSEVAINKISLAFYDQSKLDDTASTLWQEWFDVYLKKLNADNQDQRTRQTSMHKVNPKYVLRNYMAQLAIDAAEKGNYNIIDELYQLLKNPYAEQPDMVKWYAKRPEWARTKVGCSMLSCSS